MGKGRSIASRRRGIDRTCIGFNVGNSIFCGTCGLGTGSCGAWTISIAAALSSGCGVGCPSSTIQMAASSEHSRIAAAPYATIRCFRRVVLRPSLSAKLENGTCACKGRGEPPGAAGSGAL
jgi:hypothetical protein